MTAPPQQQLAKKAASGVFWNYLSFGLGKGLVLITTAVLARLLTKEEFGIVGFATLAISYLAVLKDLGLGAALIQRQDRIDEAADTVFTLNMLLGLLLSAITFLVAPWVALYFNEPQVTSILRVLGLTFVINSLGAIHIIRLQRRLNFRQKAIPDVGRSLAKGIVSIGMALAGFGVWSLVIGQLAGVIVAVILAWIILPWRPTLRFDSTLAQQMFAYGASVIGVDFLTILNDTLDYLIIGRILGSAALGVYTLAYRLPELLVFNLLWVLSGVIFPSYSAVQSDVAMLEQAFWTTMRYVELVIVPLCLGLIIAADPLVRIAFGDQWLEAIPIVRLLALFALVRSVGYHIGDIYKAIGQPDILFKLGVVSLVLLLPALLLGSRYGLFGVAVAHVAIACVRTLLRWIVAARFIDIRWEAIWTALKPSFLGGIVLALLAVPVLWATAVFPPFIRLTATAIAGGLGYLAVLWQLERDSLLMASRYIGLHGVGSQSIHN